MWIPRASRRASGRERGPAPRGSPSTPPRARNVNSGLPWSEQDDSDPLWMINNRRDISAMALFLCRPPRRLSEPAPGANTRSGSVPRGAAAGSGHSSFSPTRPESISSRSCAAVLPGRLRIRPPAARGRMAAADPHTDHQYPPDRVDHRLIPVERRCFFIRCRPPGHARTDVRAPAPPARYVKALR
jgi:hypothetical protein